MKQLFEVGEAVILQSKYFPEHNGEYVVQDVDFDKYKDMSGVIAEQYTYNLGFSTERGPWWKETSIKKKQEPGDMGYKELMASLKSPVFEM